jgi:hypothetical protein
MPAEPAVEDLYLDAVNVEKIAQHGIVPRQLLEVLDNGASIFPNREDQSAPYLLIGLDDDGQCLAMPIWPTEIDETVWRPVTAWYCKPSEWARLGQDRRRR